MENIQCPFSSDYCGIHSNLCIKVRIPCDDVQELVKTGGAVFVVSNKSAQVSTKFPLDRLDRLIEDPYTQENARDTLKDTTGAYFLVFLTDETHHLVETLTLDLILNDPLDAQIIYYGMYHKFYRWTDETKRITDMLQGDFDGEFSSTKKPTIENLDTAVIVNELRNHLIKRYKDMPYDEYLKTEHWRERREEALYQAKNKCQVCGKNHNRYNRLEVHHNTYQNRGNEKPEDLIVLCRNCHQMYHATKN